MPRRAFRRACERDVFALSQAVWDEVAHVLDRPRLARFVRPELRAELLDTLRGACVWFDPSVRVLDCRDAKDNKYLELAPAAGAGTLVSSDDDLRPAEYLAASDPGAP